MQGNFEDIWKYFVKINSFAGLFTFKENTMKTRKQKFFQWICNFGFFWFHIMLINTIHKNLNDLMNLVMTVSIYTTGLFTQMSCLLLVHHQEDFLKVIDWCRNFYSVEKYHPLIKEKAINQINITKNISYKAIKVSFFGFNLDALCVTFGSAILYQFLPINYIGKYQPPLPFYVPFLKLDNWITYSITIFSQYISVYIICQYFIYVFATIAIVSIHFLRYLDLIIATVIQMKIVLMKNQELKFENQTKEWTKTICDMISELKK